MTVYADSLFDLSEFLTSANTLFISGCAAEVAGLDEVLAACERTTSATISGIFLPGINTIDYSAVSDQLRCQTYFMTPQLQQGCDLGRVDYCPWRYRDIVSFYQRQPVDVALIMLSQPNDEGLCSYGVCADYAPLVLPKANIKIGIINKQMPYTEGWPGIAVDDLDVLVEIDQPLKQVPRQEPDKISKSIAGFVADYIGDGATLQLGLGKVPSAVADALSDRKNLKVISGLLDEAVLTLDTAGALADGCAAIGGVALGTESFYRALDHNSKLSFQPVSVTHNISTIAQTPNFVAINGAMEVDVFGQVNSSITSRGHFSGPGGLPEFVNGALASDGGRSIIVLPATAAKGKVSKIVATLTGSMPSVSAVDADIVISEFGSVELRGKSLSQRVAAMISIAAPEHRESLLAQTQTMI